MSYFDPEPSSPDRFKRTYEGIRPKKAELKSNKDDLADHNTKPKRVQVENILDDSDESLDEILKLTPSKKRCKPLNPLEFYDDSPELKKPKQYNRKIFPSQSPLLTTPLVNSASKLSKKRSDAETTPIASIQSKGGGEYSQHKPTPTKIFIKSPNLTSIKSVATSSSASSANSNPSRQPTRSSSIKGSRLVHIDENSSRLLEGEQMLNDTIVDIYLSHLLDLKEESWQQKIHLFSTFFYCKFRTIYIKSKDFDEEVKRWEKDIKLFDKQYLVIPICVSHHWVLVIVRLNTDSVHTYAQDQYRSGCLVIFDSLGMASASKLLTQPIREFLKSRWKFERPGVEAPDFGSSKKFVEVYAIVPKQRNSSDCGVYLLNSFSKFFIKPKLNLKKLQNYESLALEWSFDPRQLRAKIRSEIKEAKS